MQTSHLITQELGLPVCRWDMISKVTSSYKISWASTALSPDKIRHTLICSLHSPACEGLHGRHTIIGQKFRSRGTTGLRRPFPAADSQASTGC